jgi:hypothetical protein
MSSELKTRKSVALGKVEAILTNAEKYAKERKVPYLDFVVSYWKQHGTLGASAKILASCGKPYDAGPSVFRDYILLEINKQYHMALSAGYSELMAFRYTKEDLDYAVDSLKKIMEALKQ